ncbi:MAG TPA: hypothetical protein VGI10_27480 [Polyangiaceae bacterium]|jgi:hypothetical protein
MFARRFASVSFIFALSAPFMLGLTACASGTPEAQHSNVKPGPMPSGAEWQGVYYSQLYGNLHLLAEGKTAQGAWRVTAGDAYGELSGEIDGNLLRYEWTQHKIGQIGGGANSKGKGYFVYQPIKEGEAQTIAGEWGLNDSDAGNKWDAVKQKNMEPNPKSVKPDEIEGRMNAGGWDKDESSGDDDKKKKDDDSN